MIMSLIFWMLPSLNLPQAWMHTYAHTHIYTHAISSTSILTTHWGARGRAPSFGTVRQDAQQGSLPGGRRRTPTQHWPNTHSVGDENWRLNILYIFTLLIISVLMLLNIYLDLVYWTSDRFITYFWVYYLLFLLRTNRVTVFRWNLNSTLLPVPCIESNSFTLSDFLVNFL